MYVLLPFLFLVSVFNGYFLESGNHAWSEKSPCPSPPLLRHSSLAGFSTHPRSDSLEVGLGQAVLKSGLQASIQSSFSGLCGTDPRLEVAAACVRLGIA